MKETPENAIYDRRSFLRRTAMTVVGAQFAATNALSARSERSQKRALAGNASKNSFGPLKQIDAGLLDVGYAEFGPADGRPVLLLHGWPYDIYSFVDVAPLLAVG
jgi:hypothetical protein